MDQLDIFVEPEPDKIIEIEKNNLYDEFFQGTKKLWKDDNSELIKYLYLENIVIGRTFIKKGKISYFEIFEDKRSNILGMSKKITFLYAPNEINNEKYNDKKIIGFRYYEIDKARKCNYFTLVKKYDLRFFILEKEEKIFDSEENPFFEQNLNCFSIMRKIVFEKYEIKSMKVPNGELFPELIGYIYSMISLGKFKNFIPIEPLILDTSNPESKIERLPSKLEDNIGYIEPVMYNNHISVLLIKKSNKNIRKRVNIFIDMSGYHTKENILDLTIFPYEIYINNYIYPNFSLQKNNTCGLWYYGIMECIYSNENYNTIKDVCINISNNNTRFYIDIINSISNKVYNNKNIIDMLNINNDNDIVGNRIYGTCEGNTFSFQKESFQNYFFSLSSIFGYTQNQNQENKDLYQLELLFDYQYFMDKIKDFLRLVELNNTYFKYYSQKKFYENNQKMIYEKVIEKTKIMLEEVNDNFEKVFINTIYDRFKKFILLGKGSKEKKEKINLILSKHKNLKPIPIKKLKLSFDNFRRNIKYIAVKDESSIIKNINPNNEFIFQLMNN